MKRKIFKMWGVWNTSWEAYWDIHPHFDLVKMCGYPDAEIEPISVFETPPGDWILPTHWAWYDNKDQDISMIWPEEGIFEMCFPYGSKEEINAGRGQKIRVCVVGVKTKKNEKR